MADADPTNLWRYAGMGLEFAGSLLGMGLIGWLIDSQAGTSPWGILIGVLLGLVGGLYLFIKRALEALRRSQPPHADGSDKT